MMCAADAPPPPPPRFSSLDVRVGKIVEVWEHPDSDKLFCERIDVGEAAPREIASGLRAYYALDDLKDRSVLVVCNLKPAKLAGFESAGMVFCASEEGKGKVEFIDPPAGASPGDRVLTQSEADALAALEEGAPAPAELEPASGSQMKKKKVLEKVCAGLKTDGERAACYLGEPLVVAGGRCTAASIAGGSIS
jgi:methionine--tRNA ligase beta chain